MCSAYSYCLWMMLPWHLRCFSFWLTLYSLLLHPNIMALRSSPFTNHCPAAAVGTDTMSQPSWNHLCGCLSSWAYCQLVFCFSEQWGVICHCDWSYPIVLSFHYDEWPVWGSNFHHREMDKGNHELYNSHILMYLNLLFHVKIIIKLSLTASPIRNQHWLQHLTHLNKKSILYLTQVIFQLSIFILFSWCYLLGALFLPWSLRNTETRRQFEGPQKYNCDKFLAYQLYYSKDLLSNVHLNAISACILKCLVNLRMIKCSSKVL